MAASIVTEPRGRIIPRPASGPSERTIMSHGGHATRPRAATAAPRTSAPTASSRSPPLCSARVVLVVLGWFGYALRRPATRSAPGHRLQGGLRRRGRVHLEVHKDSGTSGYCTVRSQAADDAEVGRKDFRFDGAATRSTRSSPCVRRPRRHGELLGCHCRLGPRAAGRTPAARRPSAPCTSADLRRRILLAYVLPLPPLNC